MKTFWPNEARPPSGLESGGAPKAGAAARTAAASAAFLAVFSIAYLSILATRGAHPVAPVWPVNALVLVAILRSPLHRALRWEVGAGAFAGFVLANWLGGSSPVLAVCFTIANAVEIAIAFLLVRGVALRPAKPIEGAPILEQFKHLIRAGLLAPLASASIAAASLALFSDAPIGAAWLDWYFAAALGLTIVAPLGVRLNLDDWRRLRSPKGAQSALGSACLVAGLSLFVFWQDQWPLLFLITPAILRAAGKTRSLGAAASVILVALIAVPLTAHGHGPLSLIRDGGVVDRQFLLQVFLLSHSLMALRIAAILDERDSLQRALEIREALARDRAEAQMRLLSFAAHELRTPLNVISGMAEVLQKSDHLSKDDTKLVAAMVGASAQMQTLANDLLDRSRLEAGALRLRPEQINLSALLTEAAAEAKASADLAAARLSVEAGPDLWIWADAQRTKQILRNLIDNAIKYAGGYGPIRITARANGETCKVEIIDHGPGIAAARHQDLFEPFSRLGPDSASNAGAGFGLSMVKLLAEAQGGAVGFSSAPHIETRLWVTLPVSKPAHPHPLALDDPDFDPASVFPG